MKIHRDLGIRQATAWHLMQRIREAFATGDGQPMPGPVEVDETYVGGKERNKHESQRRHAGRGTVGKVAVVGIKDRQTNQIAATPVQRTPRPACPLRRPQSSILSRPDELTLPGDGKPQEQTASCGIV